MGWSGPHRVSSHTRLDESPSTTVAYHHSAENAPTWDADFCQAFAINGCGLMQSFKIAGSNSWLKNQGKLVNW
jgi:hypothetical protein